MKRFLYSGLIMMVGFIIIMIIHFWGYKGNSGDLEATLILLPDSSPAPSLSLDKLHEISLGEHNFPSQTSSITPIKPGLDITFHETNEKEKEEGDALFKDGRLGREGLYHYMLTYPGDGIPRTARAKAYQLIRKQIQHLGREPLANVWQSVGPNSILGESLGQFQIDSSGRTTAILVHPQNPDIVYAGMAQGGVWKTTNGGLSWVPLTDQQPSLVVGTMAFDPTNPNILFVGTGEPSATIDTYYGVGILKTVDGGASWVLLGEDLFAGMGISSIVVDPKNTQKIYAAVSDRVVGDKPVLASPGLYQSTDGGASWNLMVKFCTQSGVCTSPSALVIDPIDSKTLYAGIDYFGIIKSTDSGLNWSKVLGVSSPVNRVEVAISPSNNQVLYAGLQLIFEDNTTYGVLFKSTDAGGNWTYLNTLPVSYCGEQCGYNNMLAVHPTNPQKLLAGGQAIYSNDIPGIDGVIFTTTDGGESWTTNSGMSENSTIHPDLHAIAFAPSNPNVIWIGNDGGVYRSKDGGITWENRNTNLATLQFQSAVMHPADHRIIFGGMQDNAKAKTTDGGSTWTGVDVGDGGFTAIDFFNPNYWYGTRYNISGQNMQFQRNDFNGSSPQKDWPVKINGIDINDRVLFYAPLQIDPNIAGRVYWGTHRLYRSNDRGENWGAISPDLTKNQGPYSAISTFAIMPGNSSIILVGTADGNIQLTANGGSNWTNLTKAPLPNRYVSAVAIRDSQTIYAAFSGFNANTQSTPGHVFKTMNGGQTWVDISYTGQLNGLPDLPVLSLEIDMNSPENLYLGTDLGVYRSTNGGSSWETFNQGLPLVAVFDLDLKSYQEGTYLIAATHGRGIWQIELTGSKPKPTATSTSKITPSPTATSSPTPTASKTSLPGSIGKNKLFLPVIGNQIKKLDPYPTNTPTPKVGATATKTPTSTVSPKPTLKPSSTPTPTPTKTQSLTPTGAPSQTESPTPTQTHTPTSTSTLTPTPSQTPSILPSNSPTATFTPTPTKTSSPTPTPTFTFTPKPDLIKNGDFELGTNGDWVEYSSNSLPLIINSTFPVNPHSGQWFAWLGGLDDEISVISQTVTLPASASLVLNFYYQFQSDETIFCSVDVASVVIDSIVVWQEGLCQSIVTDGWIASNVDISGYSGQTVTIYFYLETDFSLPSSWFLDDIWVEEK